VTASHDGVFWVYLMKFTKTFFQILIIGALAAAGLWLIRYGQIQKQVHTRSYAYTPEQALELDRFAEAQYDFGRRAQLRNDPVSAASYYRKAAAADPLHVGAWLRLAETWQQRGEAKRAKSIVRHTHKLTRAVLRWKWPETLLAYELGLESVFWENINYLVSNAQMTADALRLANTHCNNNVDAVLSSLAEPCRAAYLEWLMHWNRIQEARKAWTMMPDKDRDDPSLRARYVHFLVQHKQIADARLLWKDRLGDEGITNPGFEKELLLGGFGWRSRKHPNDLWIAKRSRDLEAIANHVMKVSFFGKENVAFHHLYQIVAVVPLQSYRLSYRYRMQNITTDQGPFVEVYGYDCRSFHHKGPMMLGSGDWNRQTIEFSVPEPCSAVVLRLRRLPSQRFDNKIDGTLWLDDFRLQSYGPASDKVAAADGTERGGRQQTEF